MVLEEVKNNCLCKSTNTNEFTTKAFTFEPDLGVTLNETL